MAIPRADMDTCKGFGLCAELCPKVFELRDDRAWVAKIPTPVIAVIAGRQRTVVR